MNKVSFISIGLLIAVCIAVLLFIDNKSSNQSSDNQLNTRLIQVITDNKPSLVRDGNPTITTKHISTPEAGWYIVTIKSIYDTRDNPVAVRAIINKDQNSDRLQAILGPGVSFTEPEMLQYNIPDSVIKEFKK